jgi:hypothetical protein
MKNTSYRKESPGLHPFCMKPQIPRNRTFYTFTTLPEMETKGHSLQMERENLYSTVSITGISLMPDRADMKYHDLKERKIYESEIELTTDYIFI